jgi:hypothetical protein
MRYSYQSTSEHNFFALLKRGLYKLVWPVALIFIIQYGFPKSTFAKDNWHLYSLLFIEAFNVFLLLTSDSISEIIIDTAKKYLEVSYYNIYQGKMEETYPFTQIKVHIEDTAAKEVKQIEFIIKKRTDITLEKNNFSTYNLESMKDLLYTITSPKSR